MISMLGIYSEQPTGSNKGLLIWVGMGQRSIDYKGGGMVLILQTKGILTLI
jgi:hypothetical protein